ncbi:glycosyltransferase [Chitinophagaceae bacterium 26-R-25]|nr:glycosyltransferase [Chitinophagaceae bacterium 26-R-25]
MKNLDFITLIPCYNNIEGLKRSIRTISYSPDKCAILVVDDGSNTAVSLETIEEQTSIPVFLIRLTENKGITEALNAGLGWILNNCHKVKYISRLDCGDECAADRFYKQVGFLDTNEQVAIVGSWCKFKNLATGDSYQYKTPVEHNSIIRKMHFKNVFIHPTVMWRTDITRQIGLYPMTYPHAEDYGFFYKILGKYKTAVIAEYLMTCEITLNGISLKNRKEQLKSRIEVVKKYGSSKILTFLGTMKLLILMLIPSTLLLTLKHKLFN